MTKDAKRGGKSETLTIRLDPKTRFILEFMQRLRGQTLTTVVERAIAEAGDRASFNEEHAFGGEVSVRWQDLWSVSEGERALMVAAKPQLFPTFEEEKRRDFARRHWPFFYRDQNTDRFLRHYVDVLWPRIDEFIEIFESTRAQNYFAAGFAMKEALRSAGLAPPDWPSVDGADIEQPQADIPF